MNDGTGSRCNETSLNVQYERFHRKIANCLCVREFNGVQGLVRRSTHFDDEHGDSLDGRGACLSFTFPMPCGTTQSSCF